MAPIHSLAAESLKDVLVVGEEREDFGARERERG